MVVKEIHAVQCAMCNTYMMQNIQLKKLREKTNKSLKKSENNQIIYFQFEGLA
jgi:hypothetical protein